MSDRALKCAEEINELHNLTDDYDADVAAIIRSHFPDDSELLEAAKAALPFIKSGNMGQVCPGCGANMFEFGICLDKCPL